ncbi:hypothetical protein VNO78_16723 [Psophocarpus tetragonolobus]|uniref:Uncharacterized protein n=1 Tax=Psophocarpus tetragonolobus TaxID=3891 RepID=A0AAN9XKN7_PSOTE
MYVVHISRHSALCGDDSFSRHRTWTNNTERFRNRTTRFFSSSRPSPTRRAKKANSVAFPFLPLQFTVTAFNHFSRTNNTDTDTASSSLTTRERERKNSLSVWLQRHARQATCISHCHNTTDTAAPFSRSRRFRIRCRGFLLSQSVIENPKTQSWSRYKIRSN